MSRPVFRNGAAAAVIGGVKRELEQEPMLREQEKPIDSPVRVVELPGVGAPAEPNDPRVDLKELIHIIKRRHMSILWTAAVPTVLALLYGLIASPLYTASTQLLIDPRDRRIISNEVTPEAMAPDGGIAMIESQLLVVTSDTVLRRVIARERLDTDPEFGGPSSDLAGMISRAVAPFGLNLDGDGTDPELKALRALKKKIGAKRSDKAYVVDVYVTTRDRGKSVRIADGVAQAYLEDQASARAAASGRASAALTGRLEALRARVEEAESRVVAYKERHKMVAAGGVLVTEQQLSDITVQLSTVRARTAEARARYEQIARARQVGIDTGATPEAVLSQTIGQLRTQYADAARQRAQLGAMVGPRHPSIANLDAQLASIRKLIDEELTRITTAARSDLERAQANQESLERDLERLKKTAGETDQASVRLRELEREAEARRAGYQAFLVRARETGEQQSIDNTNARVISKATPPKDKAWPPRILLTALALIGGLGIGTGIGLMREYFDERIYSSRALAGVTGLRTLAILPQPGPASHFTNLLGRLRRRRAGQLPLQTTSLIEAMRLLRDRLYSGKPSRSRSLLVISATENEDQTNVALNLALTAAADGWRVLLIDAESKYGLLSKTLNAENTAGFLDVLAGRANAASTVLSEIETGLKFIPVGTADTGAQNLDGLAQKLMLPNVDLTIIDAGAVASDRTRLLAGLVDDVILVVRAGGPKRTEIKAALEALPLSGRKVRGAVLTGASDDVA
jgi:polysaccharide biosynthesis transport protein